MTRVLIVGDEESFADPLAYLTSAGTLCRPPPGAITQSRWASSCSTHFCSIR